MMTTPDDRSYSDEEVRAILARALEKQQRRDMSHEDLIAAAREVGVSEAELEEAAREEARRRENDREIEEWRTDNQRGLRAHTITWLSVTLLLASINVITGGIWWFLIPTLAWAVGLAAHWNAVRSGPTARALDRRRHHRERQQRRIEMKRRFEGGADAIGVIVEHGIKTLADHLAQRGRRLPPPDHDDRGRTGGRGHP